MDRWSNDRKGFVVFLAQGAPRIARFEVGIDDDSGASFKLVFTRDSELVGEDWHVHHHEDDEEEDANEHCILAVARVEMVCHYDNLMESDGGMLRQYNYFMLRSRRVEGWWEQLRFYRALDIEKMYANVAVPAILGRKCWINQLPQWMLEHVEAAMPRPPPQWFLNFSRRMPPH